MERIVIAILVLLALGGCNTRVIIVTPGKPMLLAEEIKKAKVFVKDSNGELVETTADLPAGYIVAPMKDRANAEE